MEALAHLLSLPTLHDDRKVTIGPLGQVFHGIMCLGLHHRDTVDLDPSALRPRADLPGPPVRSFRNSISHEINNLRGRLHVESHLQGVVPTRSPHQTGFLDDLAGLGKLSFRST